MALFLPLSADRPFHSLFSHSRRSLRTFAGLFRLPSSGGEALSVAAHLQTKMAPTADIHGTVGPMFLGMVIGLALWGVSCIQTWYYYDSYKTDTRYMKALVFFVFTTDTLHQGIICRIVYKYTISFFGDVAHVESVDSGIYTEVLFNALTGMMVQCFFTYRIWQFRKQTLLTAIISLLIVGELAVSIAYSTQGLIQGLDDFTKLRNLKGLSMSINVLAAIGDLMISGAICTMLNSSKTGHAWSNHVLNRLMLFSINTGMVTSLCACCSLLFILVLDERRLVYICFYFIIGRLYSNSLLATLNARQRIRGDSPDNDDNDPFSLPITFTHSLTQRSRPSIFSNPCGSKDIIPAKITSPPLQSSPYRCAHISPCCGCLSSLCKHPLQSQGDDTYPCARPCAHPHHSRSIFHTCPRVFGAYTERPSHEAVHQHSYGHGAYPDRGRGSSAHTHSCTRLSTPCLYSHAMDSNVSQSGMGRCLGMPRSQNDPRAPVLTPVSIQLSGDQLPESMYDKDTNHSDLLSPSRAGQTRDSSRQNRHSSRSSWRSSRSILSPLTVWRAWSNASDRSQGSTCGNADAVQERGIRLAELNLNAERDKKAPSGQQDSDEGQGAEDDDQDITDITDSYISTPSTPSRYSLPPLQTSFGVITSQSGEITSPETSANSDDKLPNFGREYQFTDRRQSVASHRHMSEIRYSAWTQTDEDSHDDNLWHGSEKSQTRQRVSTFGDLGY